MILNSAKKVDLLKLNATLDALLWALHKHTPEPVELPAEFNANAFWTSCQQRNVIVRIGKMNNALSQFLLCGLNSD
jgi:hypothetical protein